MEDRELIRRIQNGQKEYLNEIAGKYYDDIYYFCCYRTGSWEDAYDLTQETFLRFIRYVGHYRYRNLKGYLLTIAMNLCREYMGGRSRSYSDMESDGYVQAERKSEEKTEESMLLADALMQLPQAQREAVILHHFYGYKNREISHMTGASCAAVKSRIRQGLEKLKRLLDQKDFHR